MLLILMVAVVINVAIQFRNFSYERTLEKANTTAEFVRDGLTAHMVNGIMDKRDFFLDTIQNRKDIKQFWIIRGESVIKQFGKGFENEHPRDIIDQTVLQSGKTISTKIENTKEVTFRVTIPYVATAYGHPNCLECHNAKEGDVLGAISMEFDIKNTRYSGIITILKIIIFNLLFLIIALLLIHYFFKPITTLFSELGKMVFYANQGDFSKRISLQFKGSEQKVIDQINSFFTRLEETFHDLKQSLSTFVSHSINEHENPLETSQKIIHELSNIYKFKKTIELDKDCHEIFLRIATILSKNFNVTNYKIFLIDKEKNSKTLITQKVSSVDTCCCDLIEEEAELCRAYRTGSDVFSNEFENICPANQCAQGMLYVCIPVEINQDFLFIVELITTDQKEYDSYYQKLENIKNYLEAAKPILESKFLMKRLQESSLLDGLTGLYNRYFLEQFIEQFSRQIDRAEKSYAILMIDIDHFKQVNDTYGHDVGDTVIKELANVLKSSIRSSDMAIRYGGEEFLVFLYNPQQDKVRSITNKILYKFKEIEFKAQNKVFKKTLSVGIAYYPEQGRSIWQVIKYADMALYKAKENGRDQIVEFDLSFLT